MLATARSLVAIAVLTACAAPPVTVDVAPGTAVVRLDGVPIGEGSTTFPAPYYGLAALDVAPPPTSVRGARLEPQRVGVPLPPPAPLWLFPFDFFIDLAIGPWRSFRVRVDLPEAPEIVPGERPDLEPLRRRAHIAALER